MIKNSVVLYDSGLGGVAILKEIVKLNPDFNITYIADNAFFPIGDKSVIDIQERCKSVAKYVFEEGANIMILACNSATVSSIRELQYRWLPNNYKNKNILGVSTPLLEMMKGLDIRDELGVILSTNATVNTGFYQSEFLRYGFRNFIPCPSKDLASSIESCSDEKINKALESVIDKNLRGDISYIVLACTHYHFAKEHIKRIFGNKVAIIDPTSQIASKIDEYVSTHKKYTVDRKNRDPIIYYTDKYKKPKDLKGLKYSSLEHLPLDSN